MPDFLPCHILGFHFIIKSWLLVRVPDRKLRQNQYLLPGKERVKKLLPPVGLREVPAGAPVGAPTDLQAENPAVVPAEAPAEMPEEHPRPDR